MEDDLDVASDIFEFFAQGRELLRADPTLFCVSAWNDNGKSQHVADPHRLYRTDFFAVGR
jgi:alpha-1,3-mannosyl-glycoprotein beta-1,2-N-acetylglucosaminyltransferase